VLAALYSLVIGLPCFRLTGPYFSIATIGIGEATRLIALNWTSLTGGASGVSLAISPPIVTQYFAALALLVVVTLITVWMQRSRLGYALAAVRSDPDAAQTLGVNTTIAKTQALVISANFQNLDLLAFGILLMAIVLFEPKGLLGAYKRLATRKPKAVPARRIGASDA